MFWKIRKFDRKTSVLVSAFNKVAFRPEKKRLQHRYYLVKFAKFLRALFLQNTYGSDCFCVLWKSGENFSPEQLRKSHVGRQQIYWELHCRHSRGNFSKLIEWYPQLFLLLSWVLRNFELYYICAVLWIIVK